MERKDGRSDQDDRKKCQADLSGVTRLVRVQRLASEPISLEARLLNRPARPRGSAQSRLATRLTGRIPWATRLRRLERQAALTTGGRQPNPPRPPKSGRRATRARTPRRGRDPLEKGFDGADCPCNGYSDPLKT